ncbi:hypothetical protein Fcan01_17953 [Folsomia candida]|uniref:Uncharacterized protein n=1 Tax=Folsomia candida TaxID=158441 RepID=A0A226DTJ8_FOLCA|nr:hypothetical protein Fcan01_17953 [Folsomia candida]
MYFLTRTTIKDPDYFVFQDAVHPKKIITQNWIQFITIFHKGLQTGEILFYETPTSEISLYCYICARSKKSIDHLLIPIRISNPETFELNKLWFQLHLNLNLYPISHYVNPNAIEYFKSGLKSHESRTYGFTMPDILLYILSMRMNYTITQPSKFHVGGAYMTLLVDKSYNYLMADKYIKIFNGAKKVYFRFQMFALRITGEDYLALISPYDLAIWCVIVVQSGLVIGLFRKFDVKKILKVKEIGLHFFVTVLDQPLPDRMLFSGMRVFLCAWFLGFVVVNNLYKSFMISSLAAPGSLKVPTTLGELATWDKYPIQSITFTRMLGSYAEPKSILKNVVIPHILRLAENGSQQFRMFEILQTKSKYCDPEKINIVQFAISTCSRTPVIFSSLEELTLSGVFAVIDVDETLSQLGNTFNFFSQGYRSIRNNDADFYTNNYAWLVDRNFFGVMFSTKLNQIVDSGIFNHVQNLEKIGVQLHLADNADLINVTRFNWGVNFQRIISGIPYDSGGEDETMDLTKLWIPLALVLMLLSVGLVIFIGKMVHEVLKRGKSNVLRLSVEEIVDFEGVK